jgi:hypothetical protein
MYAINFFYFKTALTAFNMASSHLWHLRMSTTIEPSSTSKTDMHLKGSVGEETLEYPHKKPIEQHLAHVPLGKGSLNRGC